MMVTTLRRASATRHPSAETGATLLFVPLDRLAQSVAESSPRNDSEALAGAACVHAPPWLTVGLRRVPPQLAAIARGVLDHRGQVGDGNLLAAAEIDRLGVIVGIGHAGDTLRRVAHEEELASRRAGAPDLNRPLPRIAGGDHPANERRDDVACPRIEVVAGAIEVDG